MSISTNDLKNGMALNLPEGLMTVVEFQHVKPGKGGAFVRTKLKNVRTGAVVDKTFRADEKVEHAVIDKREMQYLYREGNDYVFMDNESYDQLQVPDRPARRRRPSTSRRATPRCCRCYDGEVLGVDLPAAVELTVTETEPGVQGDRVSGARKAATLETGSRHPGAAVRRDRREAQGRHPHRRLPHPRVAQHDVAPRRESRERALGLCYELEVRRHQRGRAARRPSRRARRRTRSSCCAGSRSTRRARRAAPGVLGALGGRADARGGPRGAAARLLRARPRARRADRGRDQRGRRPGEAVLDEGLRAGS